MESKIRELLEYESALIKKLKEDVFIMKKGLKNNDDKTNLVTQRKIERVYRLMDIIERDKYFFIPK